MHILLTKKSTVHFRMQILLSLSTQSGWKSNNSSQDQHAQQTHPCGAHMGYFLVVWARASPPQALTGLVRAGPSTVEPVLCQWAKCNKPPWGPYVCQNWAGQRPVQACLLGVFFLFVFLHSEHVVSCSTLTFKMLRSHFWNYIHFKSMTSWTSKPCFHLLLH